ncbi:protein misato homolog 1-like [Babylonia areolata]|uniref:protein misato homolog 1-like n=1 Tax=Babylonia areolata TaxID=304850 RepID=UPI003FD53850
MSGREIITLQLGHYANFTGAHWWNIQEASFVYDPKILQTFPKEINHDVLFREGQTLKGDVTFTPRLVALDLKGSLNSLRKDGTLYTDDKEEEVKWSGDVTLHKSDPGPRNQFLQDLDKAETSQEVDDIKGDTGNGDWCGTGDYEEKPDQGEGNPADQVVFGKHYYNLDEHVKVWSDYLSVHLHPRSVQIVQDFILDNEDHPFDVFGLGQQTLCDDAWDEWEDRVRFFTEDCDLMQGFHLLFDGHNSFGGAASKVLSYLKDEFPGKPVLSVPLTPAVVPDQTVLQRATRILNSALCLGNCGPSSSLYLPLSLASSLWKNLGAPRTFPHLLYNCDLAYHTSAVLAASLDTMTLPFRQETNPVSLSDITSALTYLGRKVTSLNTSVPFPMLEEETLVDTLMSEREKHLWHSLTPHVSYQSSPMAQSCVIRGIPTNKIKRASSSPRHLSSCSSVQDVLQLYLTETYPRSMNAGCVLRDPVKVGTPFPHIFHPSVTQTGFLSASQRPPRSGVESVPMMTSLQCSTDVGDYVSSLHAEAARFNIRRHHHFLEAGLEEEEFSETLDILHSLADCYSVS